MAKIELKCIECGHEYIGGVEFDSIAETGYCCECYNNFTEERGDILEASKGQY